MFLVGQIELYTHLPVMRTLIGQLDSWDIRTCGVFLLDAHYMNETTKFFSGALVALSAMITLEIPHINLVTKMDLLNEEDKTAVQRYWFLLTKLKSFLFDFCIFSHFYKKKCL